MINPKNTHTHFFGIDTSTSSISPNSSRSNREINRKKTNLALDTAGSFTAVRKSLAAPLPKAMISPAE
jgi:hypothetical protein